MVSRRGFTLVEVLVATTLLSVAVLTMAESGTLAAGLIRNAQREEAAARLAGTLLDSLVLVPAPGGGTVTDGTLVARWSGSGAGELTLSVTYLDGGRQRVHTWEARSLNSVQCLLPPPAAGP